MKELHNTPLHLLSGRKTQIFLVILLLFLDSLVFILPYCIGGYVIPVGWDTPWYIRNMRLIKEQGLYPFFMKTHGINFFSILEYLIASAFNISFMFTEIIVPIIVGLLFPLVNFEIVKKLTRSQKLALVAMLFTIVDYSTVRITGLLHRNLFCFLLIEIAVFLVLPGFLEKPSKKRFLIFALLLVIAGLSQMETFAIAVFMLFISLIFYLKKRLLKTAKLLLLCLFTPAIIVILFEAPFLSIFAEGHIVLNPAVKWFRQNFFADAWCYLASLGAGLIPLYIVGMYDLLKKTVRNLEKYQCLFISLWNVIVIAGSFLPVFGVRVPSWRFLILVTVPPVATLGFVKLFVEKGSSTKRKALILVALIAVSLIAIILDQSRSYRPWVSENEHEKLMWISNANQHGSNVIFVLSFDKGRYTFEWAELHRHWIWAIVGTRTNVYFGDIKCLIESQPTDFENQFLNSTSHTFWNELEDFTLRAARIYAIEEWYENLLNQTCLVEVEHESGIYFMEFE